MSPRYKKPRKCQCPFKDHQGPIYKPIGMPMSELKQVTIYRDELEAMRLCDLKDFTQEEAGAKMGVSRGTVQRLLASARKKVIKAITECKALVFEKELNAKP
ncbi:MAG: DUF134 domain-containing protein [Nitrospirota bacterium]